MEKHKKILRTLDKARTGDRVLEKDWDQKIVPRTLKEVAKKYNLLGTCDPNNPVNTDPELADRFFQAGWEAALRLGFFCPDTETVIKVDEDELKREFNKVIDHFTLGHGTEQKLIQCRRPSDGIAPIFTAPLSIQMDEELYIPLVEGIVTCPLVDMQEGPVSGHRHGQPAAG